MKSTLIHRLTSKLAVSVRQQKKGVAILTVLAIITLMTVLVVSFFNMATTAKTTAKGSVEIQRVTTLKDTIINLVIAQFREASNISSAQTNNPRDIITWTSQPGAIRTFSATNPSQNMVFKLYSSDVPQIRAIQKFESEKVLSEINKDLAPDWSVRPDEFTDINRPVYTAASGDRASATGATDQEGYSYPIADPRRYNGQDGKDDQIKNTEGFSYTKNSRGKSMQGVDPSAAQLAMPVRWIYMLQDGTLGFLDDGKEFKSLNGDRGGKVSRENPIVGRLAWWADDESCKVNVNTASVPFVWDTPRTTSKEDVLLGQIQPIAGEFQRYPGHPATVDLSAVFHPGHRWTPYPDIVTPGGDMRPLELSDAIRIWDIAPFIIGDNRELKKGGSLGTIGGSSPTPPGSVPMVGESADDRIFTSLDEVYFKAAGVGNSALSKPRSNLQSEGKDPNGEFLKKLEQSQFFLTHKSHSPELTLQGFPRVSMYPMDARAAAEVGKSLTQQLQPGVSAYDVTVAVNTTIAGLPYFFQRDVTQAGSRHNELFGSANGRNIKIFKYLKELSKLPIPGYEDAVQYKVTPPLASTDEPEVSSGFTFASKYPSGFSTKANKRFVNKSGADPSDATDRSQILFNMLDYTRSINTNSAFLTSSKYDDGMGQASGICGCRGTSGNNDVDHFAAMAYSENNYRSFKGSGKRSGASEIAMIVNIAGMWPQGAPAGLGPWGELVATLDTKSRALATKDPKENPGNRFIVEVGFIVNAFSPKYGWSHQFPTGGITLSTPVPAGTTDGRSKTQTEAGGGLKDIMPFHVFSGTHNEKLTINRNNGSGKLGAGEIASGVNTSRKLPPGVIPMGGSTGPRTFLNPNGEAASIAMMRPYCFSSPDSSTTQDVNLLVDPADPAVAGSGIVRVMIYDGEVNAFNVIQAIDLKIPAGFTTGMRATFTGRSLREMAKDFAKATATQDKFPKEVSIRSFVVPHGDYRLTTTPHRVEEDVFVPNGNAAGSQRAYSFFENSLTANQSALAGADGNPTSVYGLDASIIDRTLVNKYPLPMGNNVVFASLPPGFANLADVKAYGNSTGYWYSKSSQSQNNNRKDYFSHGRIDGRGGVPNRGSSDPTETSDFDQGIGAGPDGPYMNYPDEGDRRQTKQPYFDNLTAVAGSAIPVQRISPNFLVRSPVDFGSIPTGIQAKVPWQTLRFRPDPLMNQEQYKMKKNDDFPPAGLPFANFCGPKDHFFLDMFWMPVVEPWSISEPFSTKGTINLNQQIFPFLYIERTTALHALLRGERMLAIHNDAAAKYKAGPPNVDTSYRYFINAKETIKQLVNRYNLSIDAEGTAMPFNVFRSASEICELWLVPDKAGNSYDGVDDWTLEYVARRKGMPATQNKEGFWDLHLLTGDNSRERPYANLYPRVTVRSNVFKLHLVAQTLQKAKSTTPTSFNSVDDLITAEWRGSCMIERSIDPRDPELLRKKIDYTTLNAANINNTTHPRLDRFYTYRVTEVKQLTQ